MQRENMITTRYEVDPVMACGGVYVEGKGFVEVTPGNIYQEPQNGFSLWEYTDGQGDVRACMMRIDEGQASPSWYIKPDAAGGKYYELHKAVSGVGSMAVWRSGELVYNVTLPHTEIKQPLRVEPGDIFNITAAQTPTDKTPSAICVLATFPGAPFKLEYEERI